MCLPKTIQYVPMCKYGGANYDSHMEENHTTMFQIEDTIIGLSIRFLAHSNSGKTIKDSI